MNQLELKHTNQILKELLDRNYYSGMEILIGKSDNIIYRNTYGYSNIKKQDPIREDQLYKYMSMTKPLTSTTFLIFLESNVQFKSFLTGEELTLSLETELRHIFPEWSKNKIKIKRKGNPENEITIHNLLTMSTGIDYFLNPKIFFIFYKWRKKQISMECFAKYLAKVPLTGEPGKVWHYGLNMEMLGCVADKILKNINYEIKGERITSWGDLVSKSLFENLDMNHTFYANPINKEEQKNLVRTSFSYIGKENKYIINDFNVITRKMLLKKSRQFLKRLILNPTKSGIVKAILKDPIIVSDLLWWQCDIDKKQVCPLGGSCAVGNASDYFKFTRFLLTGKDKDGNQLLSVKMVKEMSRNQLNDEQLQSAINEKFLSFEHGYGYGMGVKNTDLVKSFYERGWYGWNGVLGTIGFVDPKHDMSFIFMTNSISNDNDMYARVLDSIYLDLKIENKFKES